jgi:hypothetical protein
VFIEDLSFEQMNQLSIEHAKVFAESTLETLSQHCDLLMAHGLKTMSTTASKPLMEQVEETLDQAVEFELNKYEEMSHDVSSSLPDNDKRIYHILVYLCSNGVSRELRKLALYDVFRMQIFNETNVKLKILQTMAQLKYNEYLLASLADQQQEQQQGKQQEQFENDKNMPNVASMANTFKSYEKWQTDYRDYRSIIAAFINAANYMESQRLEEAAQFFCVTCEYNERITNALANKFKGMDNEYLLLNRRKCLSLWNKYSVSRFVQMLDQMSRSSTSADAYSNEAQLYNQQELSNLIEVMSNRFLPCFFRLISSSKEDREMIDEVRQSWLNILDSNLPGNLI